MHRLPESDEERIRAAEHVRDNMPSHADARILEHLLDVFGPVDDAWHVARERRRQADFGLATAAGRRAEKNEALQVILYRLANSIVDARARPDHIAHKHAFGMLPSEVVRAPDVRRIEAARRAATWLATPGAPRHDVEARTALVAAAADLAVATRAWQAAHIEVRESRQAMFEQRAAWDDAYRALVKVVEAYTRDDGWRAYLLSFVDRPKKAAAAAS